MARITVEDCLENEPNRFCLVRLASQRAKQIYRGQPQVTERQGNKPIVTALQEIADGKVRFRREDAAAEGADGEALTLDETSAPNH